MAEVKVTVVIYNGQIDGQTDRQEDGLNHSLSAWMQLKILRVLSILLVQKSKYSDQSKTFTVEALTWYLTKAYAIMVGPHLQ